MLLGIRGRHKAVLKKRLYVLQSVLLVGNKCLRKFLVNQKGLPEINHYGFLVSLSVFHVDQNAHCVGPFALCIKSMD